MCAKYRRKDPTNKYNYNIYIFVYMFVLPIPQLEFQLPWMAGDFKWGFGGNSCISTVKGCSRSSPQASMNDKLHLLKQGHEEKRKGKLLGLWVNQSHAAPVIAVPGRKVAVTFGFEFLSLLHPFKINVFWGNIHSETWNGLIVISKQPWESVWQAD